MIAHLWPCAPQTIYVDPRLNAAGQAAVVEWRDDYKPDWTFTADVDGATVKVIVGGLEAPYAGYEYHRWGDDGELYSSQINVADDVTGDYQGDVVRHELEHAAGFEHTDPLPFMHGAYDGYGHYSLKDRLALRFVGGLCGRWRPTSLPLKFLGGPR